MAGLDRREPLGGNGHDAGHRLERGAWRVRWFISAAFLALAACSPKAENTQVAAEPNEPVKSQSAETAPNEAAMSVAPNPLRNAYFGDLHLHTRNSYDAYLFNVRATPEDAYAFAKGGTVKHPMGHDLKLNTRPLDFLAVTDHAEYLGVLQAIDTPGSDYSKVPYAEDLFSADRRKIIAAFGRFVDSLESGERLPELSDMSATISAWQETIRSAERNNDPGTFTTFVGYEYTGAANMQNLHRNVIFAGSKVPELPFSELESQNPEDLWRWMDGLREEGIDAVAIPHNSNASDGAMFRRTMWNGAPIDKTYAELRMRNEPLVEVIQIKGQSETVPQLSPNDEFAGFEIMDQYVGSNKAVTQFAGGYVRDALKRGLEIEEQVGANPYKFGMAAGSDGHDAAGPYEEDNYFAKVGVLDGLPTQRGSVPPPDYKSWEEYEASGRPLPRSSAWGSGGLTGVWAEENTRASLFAAMRRKETFGTSGPRMRVRMFAGYGLSDVDLATDEGLRAAYERGVPMGGDLAAQAGSQPDIAVIAMRDAHSAPLQRIQIVKGWVDEAGQAKEKIFDVACSDGGAVDPESQRCADNGAKADLTTCAYSDDKGDAQLQAVWRDPEFDHTLNAFYYARVLENPTCRWSTWDAIRAGVEPNPRLAKTVQERAYTSPIWLIAADNHD